jgi:hypothetical protein
MSTRALRGQLHKLVHELILRKTLFLASSLTLTAASFLVVRVYPPFSGIDLLCVDP